MLVSQLKAPAYDILEETGRINVDAEPLMHRIRSHCPLHLARNLSCILERQIAVRQL